MDDFYRRADNAQDIDAIEGLMEEFCNSNFDINKIPDVAPVNEKFAYLARKLALEINSDKEIYWQNYWFRCCISSKCNYIFKILESRGVDREKELIQICDPQNSLSMFLTDKNVRQSYFDLGIDFLLRRYNLFGALKLCLRSPHKYRNLPKLILPRMLSAILVGFVATATSSEIWEFAVTKQSYLVFYCIPLLLLCSLYLLYECCKTTQDPLFSSKLLKILPRKIFPVFMIGIIFSIICSNIFTKIGLFTTESIPETAISCTSRTIFYSVLAFFIGILIQLLWEEKTMTESL